MEKWVRVEAGHSMGRLLHKSRLEMMVPQTQLVAVEVVRVRFWTSFEDRRWYFCWIRRRCKREESRTNRVVA